MTTNVTVDAHAGWPVKVEHVHIESGGHTQLETVPPGEKRTYAIWDGTALLVTELPAPKKEQPK